MLRQLAALVLAVALVPVAAGQEPLRVGILGVDTSHVPAFTRLMNDPQAAGDLAGVRVVAAWPGGTDIAASRERIAGYTEELRGLGVEIVDSIPDLLARVDCVLLESVDGRPHLEQVKPVFAAGKRVFIDKPLAGSLRDALAIAALAEAHGVPWFSSSSLRFGAAMPEGIGDVTGCDAWSPCPLEPTHPGLFWYGIHGVETLFTMLGPGCVSVTATRTEAGDVVTGCWGDGRIGTFRGIRRGRADYGATVFGSKGIGARGRYPGYRPLAEAIARFFKSGVPPVSAAQTLEIYAFMAAAEASQERGGVPVSLDSVMEAARAAPVHRRPNILFCIADDWSWPHAGAYGDRVVATPSFDRIAREGVLFTNAYCASPSCTPSRGAILSGQAVHRLREGANLHSFLPADIPVYPDLLEAKGYVVGHAGKGWGPGRAEAGGRARNPAGPRFRGFAEFLAGVPEERPFCFWWGSQDPHRPYEKGSGAKAGMRADAVQVPGFLPDDPAVRDDILDYYTEVQRFDRQLGEILGVLEASGRLDDTIVVVTSDNGMPFPRGKANLYDSGTRMPLAVRWKARLRGGHVSSAFVSATDFAPTFLEAAELDVPAAMTGRSLLPLLFTGTMEGRREIYLERERHAHVRAGNLSYPVRGVRDDRFLYLWNLRPNRWPAGDPEHVFAVGVFGDCDGSPSKELLLGDRTSSFFARAFAKRPEEELYDLAVDPGQLVNLAAQPDHAADVARLRARVAAWMRQTGDPRVDPADDRFDAYPYFGAGSAGRRSR